MSHRRRRQPQKIDLTDHEMLIGDFARPSIASEDAWEAALQARTIALSGFHLLKAVRSDMVPSTMEVESKRRDVVDLAGRLAEAAIAYEFPEMMAWITAELRKNS